MKRLFFCLFLIISISASSQSEIIGWKKNGGSFNGGFIYSIDSATSHINILQRISGYMDEYSFAQVLYDSVKKEYKGVLKDLVFKYKETTDHLEFNYVDIDPFGNLILMPDGCYYCRDMRGLSKINFNTMETERLDIKFHEDFTGLDSITSEYFSFYISDRRESKLIKVSDNQLLLRQRVYLGANMNFSFLILYNIDSGEVDQWHRIIGSSSNGNIVSFNDQFYFCTNESIYSYNIDSNLVTEIATIPYEFIGNNAYNIPSELFSNNDHYLYGSSRVGNNEYQNLLYRFNILNNSFDSLCLFPITGKKIYDAIFPNDSLIIGSYDLYIEDEFDDRSNLLFKYNIISKKLDTIFSFKKWGSYYNEDYGYSNKFTGSLNFHNQKIFGLFNGDKNKVLFNYNLKVNKMDTICFIPERLPENNPCIFTKGIPYQLKNNNFLFIEKLFTHPDYEEYYLLELTEYNPRLDMIVEERVLNISSDKYRYLKNIYQSNNDEFIFQSNKYPYELNNHFDFKYNYFDNSIDSSIFFPRGLFENESDSIVRSFYDTENNRYVIRFHFNSNHVDSIEYNTNNSKLIKHRSFFKDNSFLIIYLDEPNNTHQFVKYNYNTGEETLIGEDAHFLESIIENCYVMNYFLLNNNYLLLDLYYYNTYPNQENNLVIYDIQTQNYKILKSIEGTFNYEMNELPFFNQLRINTYEENGNIFISTYYEEDAKSGRLYKLDLNKEELIPLEDFENSTNPKISGEMGYMKKFRKLNINFWLGLEDSNWFNPQNWSELKVPDSTTSAHVYNNNHHLPTIDSIANCKNLIIGPNANLVLSSHASLTSSFLSNRGKLILNGNQNSKASILYKESQHYGIHEYTFHSDSAFQHILSNPMESKVQKSTPLYLISEFHTHDSIWYPISLFPFEPNDDEVYQYQSEDSVFSFYGIFKTQNQIIKIPQINQSTLYPLPNPYPSSINWEKADLSSLTHKAFYYFNEKDSSFSAYVDGLGNHSPLIRPLDAFWVWTDGNESIHLNQTARVHENEFEEEPINKTYLELEVSGSKGKDQTVIGFNEQASFGFDPEYDAFKLMRSTYHGPHIFTKDEENTISINQLADTSMMDLFVLAGERENLEIQLKEKNNIDFLVLEDLIWNTRTDLLKNSYSFEYFKSDGHYPFKLYFKPWALQPIEEADIHMYFYVDRLVVNSRKPVESAEITFYDMVGRVALEFSEQNFFHLEKLVDIPAGHYVVQFRSGDLVENLKIFVR